MSAPMAADVEALRRVLLDHHPIMRSETGPFSGCRCGQVRLGQDVIAHVAAAVAAYRIQDGGAVEAVEGPVSGDLERLAAVGRIAATTHMSPRDAAEALAAFEESERRQGLRADVEQWIEDWGDECGGRALRRLRAALASQAGDGAR